MEYTLESYMIPMGVPWETHGPLQYNNPCENYGRSTDQHSVYPRVTHGLPMSYPWRIHGRLTDQTNKSSVGDPWTIAVTCGWPVGGPWVTHG